MRKSKRRASETTVHPMLRALGSAAEHVLAIVGVATVLFAGGRWVYRTLSLSDVAGFARPVCERFPFADSGQGFAVSPRTRLIGLQLQTSEPITGVRIRLKNVQRIHRWGFSSDGLATAEIQQYVKALPVGTVTGDVVTPELPPLPADLRAELFALAEISGDDSCHSLDFASAFGGNRRILHTDPTFYSMQGLPRIQFGPVSNVIVSVLVTAGMAGLVYVLFMRPALKNADEPQKDE